MNFKFKDFTVEEKEIQHLANVLKYAKPKKKKEAQEKLFDKIDQHVEDELEKNIETIRKQFLD